MNTVLDSYPNHLLLNYNDIRSRFSAGCGEYSSSPPFPHIVLDNFIDEQLTDLILQDFPAPSGSPETNGFLAPGLFTLSATTRQLIWELNSGTFIRALEGLTGIDDLIPDPSLRGAGLQQAITGEKLPIEAIPTRDNHYNLERRIRLELYLNKGWKDEYEGHLELWNSDLSHCIQRIRPTAGRCTLFSTHSTSYFGQSRPLACPGDTTRKSIIVYYFTLGRGPELPPLQ